MIKACSICGREVSSKNRRKGLDGRLLCLPCYKEHETHRKCDCCGAVTLRGDCHKNRYHEYICMECMKAGRKYSWRHSVLIEGKRHAIRIGKWVLASGIVAYLVYLFYSLLDNVAFRQ